jgi:hypothetical protein
MKIQIKSIGGSLLFEGDFSCLADAVTAAVKSRANLQYADLRSANLRYADLRYANLQYANLQSANLQYADLQYADLRSANLRYADLQYADLQYADLRYADLQSADLRYANLQYAKNGALAVAMTRILPQGTLIGWKKLQEDIIAQIEIPADAKRSHAFGRKCRAEYAKVLAMFNGDEPFRGKGISLHDSSFVYQIGKTVKPSEKFNEDFTEECASGIHFYITREEAVAHT